MRAAAIVVAYPFTKNPPQVSFTKRDQIVQALMANGSDQNFAKSLRRRTAEWCFQHADAETVQGEVYVTLMPLPKSRVRQRRRWSGHYPHPNPLLRQPNGSIEFTLVSQYLATARLLRFNFVVKTVVKAGVWRVGETPSDRKIMEPPARIELATC